MGLSLMNDMLFWTKIYKSVQVNKLTAKSSSGKRNGDRFVSSEEQHELLDKMIADLTRPAISSQPINTDHAWAVMQQKMQAQDASKRKFVMPSTGNEVRLMPVLIRVAAVFILALAAYFMFRYEASPEYISVAAESNMGVQSVELPDGSKVYLREGASVTYPDVFADDERRITFEGEAFFEITADPSKPFRIMAGPVGVEVLGTSFNLDACPGKDQVVLSLHTGQVLFYSIDPENGEMLEKVMLKPGQSGIYSCSSGLLQRALIMEPNHLAWKSGVLEFNDTPLDEVLQLLSEHYNVVFHCEHPAPGDLKLTATFDNEPIATVVESISLIFGFEGCEADTLVTLK